MKWSELTGRRAGPGAWGPRKLRPSLDLGEPATAIEKTGAARWRDG